MLTISIGILRMNYFDVDYFLNFVLNHRANFNLFMMNKRRTSELIPLCHPLPLDKVHIDIQLVGNHAIIECECRVTHKTGVEMEVSVANG